MIEIARFADVYEAEIVAARLRADGFTPTLGGAEHAKADPFILQALGWVRLSVPDGEEITEEADAGPGRVRDRTLPAKFTLGAILLAFLAGR